MTTGGFHDYLWYTVEIQVPVKVAVVDDIIQVKSAFLRLCGDENASDGHNLFIISTIHVYWI
jgi:hypothetical protein